MVRTPKSLKIISSDQVDPGVLLTSDIASAEFNVADKLVKLDGSADVPLTQIPATLTGKDADTLDGEEAADIVTNARVKAHFPDTTANVLSDHDKAAHDALNIDADTLDSKDASNTANNIPVLDASALLPFAQVPSIEAQHIKKTPSDNIRNSESTGEESSNSIPYAKIKEITITNGLKGQHRFKFQIKSDNESAYAKVYRNGSPIGVEQSSSSPTYVMKTDDITQDWAAGDTAELWMHKSSGLVYCNLFDICYDNEELVVVDSS